MSTAAKNAYDETSQVSRMGSGRCRHVFSGKISLRRRDGALERGLVDKQVGGGRKGGISGERRLEAGKRGARRCHINFLGTAA